MNLNNNVKLQGWGIYFLTGVTCNSNQPRDLEREVHRLSLLEPEASAAASLKSALSSEVGAKQNGSEI